MYLGLLNGHDKQKHKEHDQSEYKCGSRPIPGLSLYLIRLPTFPSRPNGYEHQPQCYRPEPLHPFHNYSQIKNPTDVGFSIRPWSLLVIATCHAEDAQQVNKYVKETQIKGIGCHDVVSLSTSDDRPSLHKDQGTHQQYYRS